MRMIKKIKRIDGFRCFTLLIWDENNCELFGHVNIIYGWNGAGKSTLGIFFHHFEKKAQLPTSVSLELSYQDESNTIRKFSSQPSEATLCPICVYYDKLSLLIE